jgi:hypothetical protein
MSNYKDNPLFKQLLTEISSKATIGRTDLSWTTLTEAKKKKTLKNEAKNEPKQPEELDKDKVEQPAQQDPAQPAGGGESGGAEKAPAPSGPAPSAPGDKGGAAPAGDNAQASSAPQGQEEPGQEVDQAKEDAVKAQAELEKAKAEKGQAEKDLEKESYIHLVSQGGVSFLLGKLLSHAFQTNTVDALATEMVQKLKIQNQEEYQLFSDEMIPFKNLPGVTDLLTSMSGMVGKSAAE